MSIKKRAHNEEKVEPKERARPPARENRRAADERPPRPATAYRLARTRPDDLTPRAVLQLQRALGNRAVAHLLTETARRRPSREGNNTGLPDKLRAGVENLSGYSMGDVKVHYNSPDPSRVGAAAYTRGADIYVGPGQEEHLAHEAWHVVQQKQGRVRPTAQVSGGAYINRMSDYCGGCAYDPKVRVGPTACPYTAGYWAFLDRNRERLQHNHRMRQPLLGLDRLKDLPELVEQEQERGDAPP